MKKSILILILSLSPIIVWFIWFYIHPFLVATWFLIFCWMLWNYVLRLGSPLVWKAARRCQLAQENRKPVKLAHARVVRIIGSYRRFGLRRYKNEVRSTKPSN